jgi:hypothetical protein
LGRHGRSVISPGEDRLGKRAEKAERMDAPATVCVPASSRQGGLPPARPRIAMFLPRRTPIHLDCLHGTIV